MTFDEGGNCYLSNSFTWNSILREISRTFFLDFTTWSLLTADQYQKLTAPEIIVDEEVREFKSFTRRPYYRMRGKKVTADQAFDIIRRVDNVFRSGTSAVQEHADYIGSMNFDSWIFDRHHYPRHYGWIHADGTVGCDAITQKYPDVDEFIAEWFIKMMAFPYLDLVIAITDWDESPPSAASGFTYKYNPYDRTIPTFEESIVCGIWVHDQVLEIMSPKRTVKKYAEYVKLYEGKNRDKYLPEYYQDNGIVQADENYLKRCIEAYGLNADEELRKISW
ncbi:hypothetical protein [Enterocloster lavalensis]|uniref:hypothetical protein n=1 Tax=Enterocloster lavalensis TaxID=460384 RepID=UPI002A7FCA97|nr:hypothetical protein [Enterocloster lavalensis]